MATLLAIDPGLRACGAAYFEDETLVRTWWVQNPERSDRDLTAWRDMVYKLHGVVMEDGDYHFDELVCEQQVIYPPVWKKTPKEFYAQPAMRNKPDDILQVTGITGGAVNIFEADMYYGYHPRTWKGNMKKEKFREERIVPQLAPPELALVTSLKGRRRCDTLDAVGLGLYHLGRFRK